LRKQSHITYQKLYHPVFYLYMIPPPASTVVPPIARRSHRTLPEFLCRDWRDSQLRLPYPIYRHTYFYVIHLRNRKRIRVRNAYRLDHHLFQLEEHVSWHSSSTVIQYTFSLILIPFDTSALSDAWMFIFSLAYSILSQSLVASSTSTRTPTYRAIYLKHSSVQRFKGKHLPLGGLSHHASSTSNNSIMHSLFSVIMSFRLAPSLAVNNTSLSPNSLGRYLLYTSGACIETGDYSKVTVMCKLFQIQNYWYTLTCTL